MADHPSKTVGSKAKKKQRERYRSFMLVGDHGRIVPFKRFKGIVIGFVAILILALTASTVLSLLYWRQTHTVTRIQAELMQLKKQADELRDEKDVLLARLVIENKMPEEGTSSPSPDGAREDDTKTDAQADDGSNETPPKEVAPGSNTLVQQPEPEADAKKAPEVKLGAQIKQFEVTYDNTRAILQARFRIYNDNQPKAPLAGRIVMVFKQENDPPLKWITVPNVTMVKDIPDGRRGKIFRINNYRTMTFKAYGLKPPILYNVASVYVYSDQGELIRNQEFGFHIETPPEPKPQEKIDEPEPEQEPKSSAAEDNQDKPGAMKAQTTTLPDSKKKMTAPENQASFPYPSPYDFQTQEPNQDQPDKKTTASEAEPSRSPDSADVPASDAASEKAKP